MQKTVVVQEDPATGDLFIEFPPEMMAELGWLDGDKLDFSPVEGSRAFSIKNLSCEARKESMPVFLVETVETRKVTYLIRAREESHAHDEIVMNDALAISNERLEETIFSTREVSADEAQKLAENAKGHVHQIPYED